MEKRITITQSIIVDAEIADEIKWLNEQGVRTESSCAGHGGYLPHALIRPSSADLARELGYSPEYDSQSGLFRVDLLGRDGSFEVELADGRRALCAPACRQPYTNAEFSAGRVYGAEPDAAYLRLQKQREAPTTILLRPDEMQAVAWVCAGALWSMGFSALLGE